MHFPTPRPPQPDAPAQPRMGRDSRDGELGGGPREQCFGVGSWAEGWGRCPSAVTFAQGRSQEPSLEPGSLAGAEGTTQCGRGGLGQVG